MPAKGQRICLEALKRAVPRHWANLVGNEDWIALDAYDRLDLAFVELEREVKKAQRGHKNHVMDVLSEMLALMSVLADKCHTPTAVEQLAQQLGMTGNGSSGLLDIDFDIPVETTEESV